MYNRALNLSLHIVLLLYILSLHKAEKDLSQEQDVTGRVPSILKTVLKIGKHEKLIDFSVALTLSGRQVLLWLQFSSQRSNSNSSVFILFSPKSPS